MDLRSGESRQLTDARALVPSSLTLMPNERSLLYLDGGDLTLAAQRTKVLYRLEQGWEPGTTFAVSDDSSYVACSESRNGRYRLRVVALAGSSSNTLLESSEPVRFARFRPRRQSLLFGHGGGIALVGMDGRGDRSLKIAAGTVSDAHWSADGKIVHYLSAAVDRSRPVQLRDFTPETAEDKLVGSTTQFVSFARNADSSVFVGISGSKASPYILLLLRVARRELTVAEHRATDPAAAVVLFSTNSQRIYYHTDRQGKSAIYTLPLERFVERTETSAARSAPLLLEPGS